MKFFKTTAIAVLFACLASCGGGTGENSSISKNENKDFIADEKQENGYYRNGTDSTTPTQANYQAPAKPNVKPDWEKKIIRNATLQVEVKDYNKFYDLLSDLVKRSGGYIAQEDQNQSNYKLENVLTIKVPVAQFEETLNLIAKGTGDEKLLEKKITSEDVTGEVVDTKSRIEAKKRVRDRYLGLLDHANKMEDILQVQNEINGIQEQIEMASGRVDYLNHASAFSTIHLTFFQVLNPSAGENPEPGFAFKITEAFKTGWDFIKSILIGLISVWPLWFACLGIWIGYRRWKTSGVKSTQQ